MIPQVNDGLNVDFQIEDQPSHTYALDIENNRIKGFVDSLEAMKQAIYKILNTERFSCMLYSWNYGVELAELFGEPLPFVYPELERVITEALLADDRITGVEDFTFEKGLKFGSVLVQFTAITTEGDLTVEKVVTI